jgi:hypothetical protein
MLSDFFYTGEVISVQALKIKKKLLKLHEENKLTNPLSEDEVTALKAFTASTSWASLKAIALGFKSVALHGEAGDVDLEAIAAEINELREKIRSFHPDNVYNMDETGLMFKCLPNRGYVKRSEVKTARGTKMMKVKDRVTIYVCTNASGTDFYPLSIIGKSAKPHCFRSHSLKLQYYNQKKAWSDTATFKRWWSDFLVHIRSRTNERVLLILDNCGPHCGKAAEFMNDPQVEVVMLPPNCTSVYQPMDSGVIAMIKKNYRFLLLSKYIDMFEEREQLRKDAIEMQMTRGTKGLEQGFAPHVRDCIDLLHEVQKNVKEESIFNCWRKSTLLDRPTVSNTTAAATAPTTTAAAAPAPAPVEVTTTDASAPSTTTAGDGESNATTDASSAVVAPVDGTTAAASSNTDASVDTPSTTTAAAGDGASNAVANAPSATAVDSVEVSTITAAWNDIDIKIRAEITRQDSANDEEFRDKVSELSELVLNSKEGANHSASESGENEVELILDEFAVTVREHATNDGDVDRMLDGWVGMEDTDLMQQEIREEVAELLESALVDDSEVINEDGERDSDEDDDDIEMEEGNLNTVTPEVINDLCSQLARISVELKRLKCDNNEFGAVSSKIADASASLRQAHRSYERARVAKKQSKAPRHLGPFFVRKTSSK